MQHTPTSKPSTSHAGASGVAAAADGLTQTLTVLSLNSAANSAYGGSPTSTVGDASSFRQGTNFSCLMLIPYCCIFAAMEMHVI